MFNTDATQSSIIASLRGKYLEDAGQRVDQMRAIHAAAGHAPQPEPDYTSFKAELHTMKGMGQSFGFASITLITRRLEHVLRPMTATAFAASGDITPFLDAIAQIIEAGTEVNDDDLAEILAGLLAPPPPSPPGPEPRAKPE